MLSKNIFWVNFTAVPAPPEWLSLPFRKAYATAERCVICNKDYEAGVMTSMKPEACVDAFVRHDIWLPAGCWSCKEHLDGNNLQDDVTLQDIAIADSSTTLTMAEAYDLIMMLKARAKRPRAIDFDDKRLSSDDYETLTGLRRDQFDCFAVPFSQRQAFM